MPHGAACICSPVRTNARKTPTIIDVIKRHFLELVMAWEGRKENNQKRMIMMFQSGKHHAVCDCVHQSAWSVGRNFCGYLNLRFFPNRKNSQNIVPANNSNNKVPEQPGWKTASTRSRSTEQISKKGTKLILKTIGNRKGDCAWSCSRWQTQPEKICKLQSTNQYNVRSERHWFVRCDLQIFSGCACHLEQLHAQSPFLFPIVFSINLSLTPSAPHAQYRKRFRASYIM